MIKPQEQLDLINKYKDEIKSSNAVKKLFENKGIELGFVDYIPIRFGKLDVSARTEKGIIILNYNLLDKPETIPHYIVHEITHWLQQCFSDGPTQGSAEGKYLDNEYEIEAFQYQTDFLEETKGDKVADKYVNKVLDHHDMRGEERKEKKDEILAYYTSVAFLNKFAKAITKTIEINLGSHVSDEILNKFGYQIKEILKYRYSKELNFVPEHIFDLPIVDLADKLGITSMNISIMEDSETGEESVVAVSGISYDRVKFFALKEYSDKMSQAKTLMNVSFEQIEAIFGRPEEVYMEVTMDLFDRIESIYRIYKRRHGEEGLKIYVYPAEASALAIPRRKIKIDADGVVYEKRVVGADTFAKKILIGNKPVLKGVQGAETIEQASEFAKYKDKFISGDYDGTIRVMTFNPLFWGGFQGAFDKLVGRK